MLIPKVPALTLFSFLGKLGTYALRSTCRHYNNIAKEDAIWCELLRQDFGVTKPDPDFATARDHYVALDQEATRFVNLLVINYYFYTKVQDLRDYVALINANLNFKELVAAANQEGKAEELNDIKRRAKRWLRQVLLHADKYLSIQYMRKVDAIRDRVIHHDVLEPMTNLFNLDFTNCSDTPNEAEKKAWYMNADFLMFSLEYLATLNCRLLLRLIIRKQPDYLYYVFCGRYCTTLIEQAVSTFHADLVSDLVQYARLVRKPLQDENNYLCVNNFSFNGFISSSLASAVAIAIKVACTVKPEPEEDYYLNSHHKLRCINYCRWLYNNRETLFSKQLEIINILLNTGYDPKANVYCQFLDGGCTPLRLVDTHISGLDQIKDPCLYKEDIASKLSLLLQTLMQARNLEEENLIEDVTNSAAKVKFGS